MDVWLWAFRAADGVIADLRRRAYRALYLRSRHWQRARQSAIARAGGRCAECGSRHGLEVHHLTYARLGHESPGDLQVLCRYCHAERHALMEASHAARAH